MQMVQLLRAELRYHKVGLTTTYVVAMLFLIADQIWNLEGVHGLSIFTAITFFAALIVWGIEDDKEKRDRLYCLLSISLSKLSLGRLLFVILFQGGMFVLWLVVYFLEHITTDSWVIWSMFSMNAFFLAIVTLFIIYHDLGYFLTRKYQAYFWLAIISVTATIAYLVYIRIMHETLSFGPTFPKTVVHSAILNVIAGTLLLLSHKFFVRRKSYLS